MLWIATNPIHPVHPVENFFILSGDDRRIPKPLPAIHNNKLEATLGSGAIFRRGFSVDTTPTPAENMRRLECPKCGVGIFGRSTRGAPGTAASSAEGRVAIAGRSSPRWTKRLRGRSVPSAAACAAKQRVQPRRRAGILGGSCVSYTEKHVRRSCAAA